MQTIEVLLLDYEGAARALSLSRAALRDLVYKGRCPRVTKIGRRTFFAVSDLEGSVREVLQKERWRSGHGVRVMIKVTDPERRCTP